MKAETRILIAFILNLSFSIFEYIGGIFTGSTAILSDAVHDMGDAASIGIAWVLEKKSKNDNGRSSLLSSIFLSSILLFSSILVICNAVRRIFHPAAINYDGMILFAIVGVCVNFCAAYFTHGGDSLNQKTVSLHMLEDVLGWAAVLIGAIVMRFTDFRIIDPLLSIGVALFILISAMQNLKEAVHLLQHGHEMSDSTEDQQKHCRYHHHHHHH